MNKISFTFSEKLKEAMALRGIKSSQIEKISEDLFKNKKNNKNAPNN